MSANQAIEFRIADTRDCFNWVRILKYRFKLK